jgi:uncharacterized membrane protein
MNRRSATIVIIGLSLVITAVAGTVVVYMERHNEAPATQQPLPPQAPAASSSGLSPHSPSTGRPLGPETEQFFDEVMDHLQTLPPDGPMMELPIALCDLNEDGSCDATDFQLFQSALGRCAQDFRTLTDIRADVDADGCVTPTDQKMLFPDTPR